jgi:Protein of unknown function (DUF3995)
VSAAAAASGSGAMTRHSCRRSGNIVVMDTEGPARLRNPAAFVAACLATMSAAVSAYWAFGGTALLDTVGGSLERMAKRRDASALVVVGAAIVAKLLVAAIALAAARRPSTRRVGRLVGLANRLIGLGLTLYGGILVIAGALVLTGGIHSDSSTDRHALRWHVALWDLWFFVWGVAQLRTSRRYRKGMAPADPNDPNGAVVMDASVHRGRVR